jgi:O-antigen ligase
MFLLFLLNIWQSKSIQGFLVLGAAAIFLITIVTSKSSLKKFLRVPVYFLGVILSSAVLLDIFQKSPWKPLLYKSSVSSRGDFWNAGFQMMLDKPQNGVGLDNYGDWYNFYRSADSIKERGANVASNSSHNVFLDYGSNGGIPMFLVYFLIVSLTALAIVKVFTKSKKIDMHF